MQHTLTQRSLVSADIPIRMHCMLETTFGTLNTTLDPHCAHATHTNRQPHAQHTSLFVAEQVSATWSFGDTLLRQAATRQTC